MDNKTTQILNLFEQISAVPRSSGHEDKIRDWLQNWAAEHGLESQADAAGNLLIRVPATKGYENSPTVVLQGHMDMVCEKVQGSAHDFSKDPIELVYEGDWLHAKDTTLGADNGIAIALGLAVAEDSSIAHPPLELLFTVEEEVGLGGAEELNPDFLQGRLLINLDTEEEGVFIIGCAGAQGTQLELDLAFDNLPAGWQLFDVVIGGLHGGHSGVDIQKHFASANKLMARTLDAARQAAPVRLAAFDGGSAGNAIARDASATLACEAANFPAIQKALADIENVFIDEYQATEHNLSLQVKPNEGEAIQAASVDDTNQAIDLLLALPYGMADLVPGTAGIVETSNNLGKVNLVDHTLRIGAHVRSSVITRMLMLTNRIQAVGRLAGARIKSNPPYPSWQPNFDSKLLKRVGKAYQDVFGKTARVEIIHGGLECGTIGNKYPGMDMVSTGATLQNPHSPAERLEISSVGKVWQLLVKVLEDLK